MNKKKKINRTKTDTVRSVNNNIRSSVRKLNPILKGIVGKKVVMKRFRPRAKGRAAPILKPYSTITIILSEAKQMESHGTKS